MATFSYKRWESEQLEGNRKAQATLEEATEFMQLQAYTGGVIQTAIRSFLNNLIYESICVVYCFSFHSVG